MIITALEQAQAVGSGDRGGGNQIMAQQGDVGRGWMVNWGLLRGGQDRGGRGRGRGNFQENQQGFNAIPPLNTVCYCSSCDSSEAPLD